MNDFLDKKNLEFLFAERYAMIKEVDRTTTHIYLIECAIVNLRNEMEIDSIINHCLTGK